MTPCSRRAPPGRKRFGQAAGPALAALAAALTTACLPPETPDPPRDRTAFQRNVSVEIPAGTLQGNVAVGVPPGHRLVIEYMSGSVRVADHELVRINVITTAGGESVQHTLANHTYRREFDPPTTADLIVTWGQPMRIHADPGSTVTIVATRSENREITPTHFDLALSGHLLECGPEPGCPMR